MTSTVPQYRLVTDVSRVRSSMLVRASQWNTGAQLTNWIAGRGNMEIPCHVPGSFDTTATTYHYRIKPRYQTTRYALSVWVVTDDLTELESPFELTVPAGGTVYNGTAHYPWKPYAPLTVFVDRASQSSSETDFSFTIDPLGSDFIACYAASLEALPRYQLAAADGGSDATLFRPGQQIAEENLADALSDQVNLLRDSARRAVFHHSWGTAGAFSTTSGSFVTAASARPVLGRKLYSGDTTRTLNARFRAYCSDGSTSGEVRLTNTSGASVTVAIPTSTTTATWFPSTAGAASSFTAWCEDNTTADGLQASTHDLHTVELRRTAGAGSVRLESVSIWEP